jgi:hypothetical protein
VFQSCEVADAIVVGVVETAGIDLINNHAKVLSDAREKIISKNDNRKKIITKRCGLSSGYLAFDLVPREIGPAGSLCCSATTQVRLKMYFIAVWAIHPGEPESRSKTAQQHSQALLTINAPVATTAKQSARNKKCTSHHHGAACQGTTGI